MEELRVGLLVAATLATGLFAGVFVFYAHTVMPALRRSDDRAFVDVYTLLDNAIVNPVFLLSTFLGAPVLTAGAAVASIGEDPMGSALGALGLQLLTVVVSARFNLPRNDRLKAAALEPGRDAESREVALTAASDHRDAWLGGYRGVLGFASVVLVDARAVRGEAQKVSPAPPVAG